MFDWVKGELLSAIRVNLDKDGKRMDNVTHKGNSNAIISRTKIITAHFWPDYLKASAAAGRGDSL